jgi:GT2 family glycosyltransferase
LEKNLLVIIPVHNELTNIKKLYFSLKKKKYKILFVDDCSTDKTGKFFKKNKISFIKNNKNYGYEKTLLKGFEYALNKKYKFIISMDGDGEHNINDIKKFINHYKENKSDIIIGNRNLKPRFMEYITAAYFNLRYNVSDPFSGFILYKTEIFKNVKFSRYNDGYLVDLLKFFILKKKKISEININIKKRIDKPRVGNNFFVNIKMIKILFKILF